VGNDYTTIVEFDDPRGGSRIYLVDILFSGNGITPPHPPGDYNANGLVEQSDLNLVLLNWGTNATMPPANWIAHLPSGAIDQDELDGVLLNWGDMAVTAIPSPDAVPEAQTIALALVSIVALVAARKRGRASFCASGKIGPWSENACPPRKKNPAPWHSPD
jgi:hypothetical protein